MKYQICVSGAASGETVDASRDQAFALGAEIAKAGKTLLTGATVGLPHYAAMGFVSVKNSKGSSIGFSPASSYREHVSTYRLPTKEFDYINFTGMEYVGRDVHLVRSADAVITVGGRMGSLHELSTALESRKVCGVLLGSGGLADYTATLLKHIEAPGGKDVIYDTDPKRLVKKVVDVLDKRYADFIDPRDNVRGGVSAEPPASSGRRG
ncbi:LOG family protein [Candidatus Saccharibacteria bacterium]|nr:LOG family protein [Candidatus Saccharibacteria bacterium]